MFIEFFQKNPLYKNSIIFLLGAVASGFGGYLYQLFMGRMLTLEQFGTLATLTNFFGIVFVPSTAMSTVTTQVIARFKAQQQWGAIHDMVLRLLRFFALASLCLFVAFILLTPVIERILHIHSRAAILLFSSTALTAFLLAIMRGVLPALGRFGALSLNTTIETLIKWLVAVGLVAASFGLNGAVSGIVLASWCSIIIVYWQIKDIRRYPLEQAPLDHIPRLFMSVFCWTLALTALSSIDVVMAKRYLLPQETGLYAGMNLIGKIIFFVSVSVAGVLFPMATELFESGNHKEHQRLLIKAFVAVVTIAGVGLMVYAAAPQLIVRVFFGRQFLPAASLLAWFGLSALLLSINQLFATYYLSTRKRWFIGIMMIASVAEGILIHLHHASMAQVLTQPILVLAVMSVIFIMAFALEYSHSSYA